MSTTTTQTYTHNCDICGGKSAPTERMGAPDGWRRFQGNGEGRRGEARTVYIDVCGECVTTRPIADLWAALVQAGAA